MIRSRHLVLACLVLVWTNCKKPSSNHGSDGGSLDGSSELNSESTPGAPNENPGFSPIVPFQEGTSAKPDKVSEEPAGLPGYPLTCAWKKAPADDSLNAQLGCYLADKAGKPASDVKNSAWKVENPSANVTVEELPKTDGTIDLKVAAPTKQAVLDGIIGLQVAVAYDGQAEVKTNGRDLIRAKPATQTTSANCGSSLFTLLIIDENGNGGFGQATWLGDCTTLAAAFQNHNWPDATVRDKPSTAVTTVGSCTEKMFKLQVNGTSASGLPTYASLGLLAKSEQICQDMATQVNSLGL